jgi:hypothetical protein
MTYIEFNRLDPIRQLEGVYREEVKTLYSVGHYDGPASGVAEWKGKRYFCSCPDIQRDPRIFFLIEISEEQEKRLEDAVKNYVSSDRATGKIMHEITNDREQNGQIVGFFEEWSNDL